MSPCPTSPPHTCDEAGAAEFCGVARSTLRNWRSLRQGPPFLRLGRRIRYRLADLDRWLAQHRVDPEAIR